MCPRAGASSSQGGELAAVNLFAVFRECAVTAMGEEDVEAVAHHPRLFDDAEDGKAGPVPRGADATLDEGVHPTSAAALHALAGASPPVNPAGAKGEALSNAAACKEILRSLNESLRVEEGGIEAMGAVEADLSGEAIEGADGTWRAWKLAGMTTACLLRSVHSALGSTEAAAEAGRQLQQKATSLQVCRALHCACLLPHASRSSLTCATDQHEGPAAGGGGQARRGRGAHCGDTSSGDCALGRRAGGLLHWPACT